MIKLYELTGAEDNRQFSPYCWRIRLALAHKGLAVERIPWRFTEKEAIAFSNQERVPVMVDGDTTVYDSWNIAQYLEKQYPEPSLFGCAEAQSLSLFIKHWDEQVLAPIIFPLIILDVYNNLHPKDKSYFRENREKLFGKPLEKLANSSEGQLSKFRTSLAPLRKTLETEEFLGGKQPNFADYIILGRLQLAYCTSSINLLELNDPVYAWREKILTRYDNL